MTTKPRGGGGKALVVGPQKKRTFFMRLPLGKTKNYPLS